MMSGAGRRRPRWRAGIASLALSGLLTGLSACRTEEFYVPDIIPPSVPQGVVSVTGDEEVSLYWYEVSDRDLAGYRVYWSDAPEGPYEALAETGQTWYVDRGLGNGRTYFYGVTAFDRDGNESDMSDDIVYDTPRPEGYDLELRNASGSRPEVSAYDFSAYQVIRWDSPRADIFFAVVSGIARMIAANTDTDIQDAGYVALVDVDWAPDRGWSPAGEVDLVAGHSYVVWTADDHYAKFEVRSIQPDRLVVDWAYQVDRGNPELAPSSGPRAGGREAP
jgi:roadblock/LC7 domain-containing protein